MKKLLLLLLAIPFLLGSCSSDDEKGGADFTDITLAGKATAYNRIELDWSKVDDAYSYQVFYKAEGAAEWQTSNFVMATNNQGATIHWDGTFASFSAKTKYTLLVKAFRDSQEGSVIGESNKVEITTPAHLTLVGAWKFDKYTGAVESNMTKYNAAIAEYIPREFGGTQKNTEFIMYFSADQTYESYEDGILDEKGTYSFVDNTLTLVYGDTGKIKVLSFDLQENNLVLMSDEKERLEGEFSTSLEEIVGTADYKNFVLQSATLNAYCIRVE